MTHLPKNEVCGIILFKHSATLAFDALFEVGNIAIDWYDDFEWDFVSIDEAPKNVLRHLRLQRELEREAWRLKDGKGERGKGEVAVVVVAAIAVNAYQQASTNKQTSSAPRKKSIHVVPCFLVMCMVRMPLSYRTRNGSFLCRTYSAEPPEGGVWGMGTADVRCRARVRVLMRMRRAYRWCR
jgi:hypothetical protein